MDSIEDIKKKLRSAMRLQGTYSRDLEACIYLCAGSYQAFQIAQEDISELSRTYEIEYTREGHEKLTAHPAFKVLALTGEALRRSLRELGLTIGSLEGTSGNDEVEDLYKKIGEVKNGRKPRA